MKRLHSSVIYASLIILIFTTGLILGIQVQKRTGPVLYLIRLYDKIFYRELNTDFATRIPKSPTNDNKTGCYCKPTNEGVCTCSSSTNFDYAEVKILRDLKQQTPTKPNLGEAQFESLVKTSLGWNKLLPAPKDGGGELRTVGTSDYEGGKIIEQRLHYSHPRIFTESLYAKHLKQTNKLIAVLHGHGSNMYKSMGLDTKDYMSEIGRHLFKKGFDVIAFNSTSIVDYSNQLNGLLYYYHISMFSLWTRSVCDLIKKLRPNYKKIYVYGLSNGGTIADLFSVTCKPVNMVIVGDTFVNWRRTMWEASSASGNIKSYFLYWPKPFFSEITIFDLMKFSKSMKIYTTSAMNYKNVKTIVKFSELPLSEKNHVNVLFKTKKAHVPEQNIIDKILEGDLKNLDGVGITTIHP